MAEILRRPVQHTAIVPPASNAPKIVQKEVVIERTLQGRPGEDGAPGVDGVDGKNAFPDGLITLKVPYQISPLGPSVRYPAYAEKLIDEGGLLGNEARFGTHARLLLPGDIDYRITVCAPLNGPYAPVGTGIMLVKGGFDVWDALPQEIRLPTFMARLEAFWLSVNVEYMKNDGK